MEGQLGKLVRAARERQELSLRALAARSGVSINAISRIERGETSPTVASLRRLAQALDQPITAFFDNAPMPASVVVQREHRLRAEGEGVVLESLAADMPNQRFEPYMLTLEPGASHPASPTAHAGQEFLLCLQGSVTCQVGQEIHHLAAGDSLFFLADRTHWTHNDSQGFATLILVHERDPHAARARSPHLEF